MKTAIVTGANGFVGRALVKELLANDYKVYALDIKNCDGDIQKSEKYIFIPCDLAEMNSLLDKIPPKEIDIMYHMAWLGSAGAMRADTRIQLQNAQWTVESMQVAKKLGCRRFVGAGSIMEKEAIAATYIQGNKPSVGYVYGSGKAVAHMLCMSVASEIGMDLVWAEITNAYGVGEVSPRMVNTAIRKCIKGETPQFTSGTQNYDFIYIDDVARAFRLIGEKGETFHEYLIGSGNARPLKEFLLEMKSAIAPELNFNFGAIPFTGVNLDIEQFDCRKTELDTGFKAEITFAEGCIRTYNWLKSLQEID